MLPRLFDPASERGLTVADVVDAYLDHRERLHAAGRLCSGGRKHGRLYLGRFREDFGHLPVEQCRRGDLARWIADHPEFRAAHTQHNAAGLVVACFNWAAEDGMVDRCPYRKPRDLPTPEPRKPITGEQVRAILEAAKRRRGYPKAKAAFRLACWFLWQTGCRPCEMRRLTWDHYDDERGYFELPSKSTRKTGRPRKIVLNAKAWRLVRWLRRRRPTGHVFLNGPGKPWGEETFQKRFVVNAAAACIPADLSSYCLRHGFCVDLLEGGAGERQVADLMGHESTRYVEWYGRGAKEKIDYLRGTLDRRKLDS